MKTQYLIVLGIYSKNAIITVTLATNTDLTTSNSTRQ